MELQQDTTWEKQKKRRKVLAVVLILLLGIAAGAYYVWNFVPRGSVKERTVTIAGVSRYGKCVGPTLRGLPNGEGHFYGDDNGGTYIFEGIFVDGVSDGTGHLKASRALVSFEGEPLQGEFDGEVVAGVYEGSGSFSARDTENRRFTYTGEWKNGVPNGQGLIEYEHGDWYRQSGTFKDGCYAPTVSQWFTAVGTHPMLPYEITSYAQTYLTENEALFTGNVWENSFTIDVNMDFSYGEYAANADAYNGGVIFKSGLTVAQVVAEDSLWGYDYTTLLVTDKQRNIYFVNVLGETTAEEGDTFIMYALPMDYAPYLSESGELYAVHCAAVCVLP